MQFTLTVIVRCLLNQSPVLQFNYHQKEFYKRYEKVFSITKFLWIGGIMGILQQLLGDLDYILYQGHYIFSFSAIMDSLSLYAAIILLVIRRDVPPKYQLRDLFLFFVGLDLFYYLYVFVVQLIIFLSGNVKSPDSVYDSNTYFSKSIHEIGDFIKWTVIGLAAALWAYFATKLKNAGKKALYIIMLLPLFAVMIIILIPSVYQTIMYFITGGKDIPIPGYNNSYYRYSCEISSVLTSLTALILCLYMFLKKPTAKDNKQEA